MLPSNHTPATDTSAHSVDQSMEAIDAFMQKRLYTAQLCPWHTQQVTQADKSIAALDPLQRYMAEDETEQSAVYHGVKEGTLSITKACTCATTLSVEQDQQKPSADSPGYR
jgi:hypothetical protein